MPRILSSSCLSMLAMVALSSCTIGDVIDKIDTGINEPEREASSDLDRDGDGWTESAGDCDDYDREVYPGVEEQCNGFDDNCNGVADETFPDTDGDGIADCVDEEDCDGIDNDGDGEIDEIFPDDDGDGIPDCQGTEICDGMDNDGDGEIDEGFDRDGDGYTSCGSDETPADCDDDDPNSHPDSFEVDGDLRDNDCDGLVDEGDWTVGDLVITELMTNPDNVMDIDGEWVELYNASDRALMLNGLVLYSAIDGDYHMIAADELLVVDPGEYVVLGANANPVLNGNLNIDYEWSDFDLDNEFDGLTLEADGVTIDTVEWDDGATFPDSPGASMNLDPSYIDVTLNDSGEAWCGATLNWDTATDKGTPGTDNQYCWPTAVASYTDDSSLFLCDTLHLDGTGSTDPGGLGLDYQWELVAAPSSSSLTTADIDTATDVSPEFLPDAAGTYVFSLVVTNGFEYSPASYLTVDIASRPYNNDPLADAGEDQTYSDSAVCWPLSYGSGGYECPPCDEYEYTLDGTGSSDPDGDAVYVVEWTIVSGTATVADEDSWDPTVTVPSQGATYGTTISRDIEVQLEIEDCMGATSVDIVVLTHECTGSA